MLIAHRDGVGEVVRTTAIAPDALCQRVRDAMATTTRGAEASAAPDVLDRQGRPFAAWRDDLVAWAASSESVRSIAPSPQMFRDVLEDATAPAAHRVGAAVALIAQDAARRDRVRVVVQTAAEEHVRAALEKVLDGKELGRTELEALETSDLPHGLRGA
ncbi:MAG: hypothetical protein WCJ30_06395 [Deltaproteobacteria bacterium]